MDTKIEQIQHMIEEYAGIDGSHHKQWLINEILKITLDDNEQKYYDWVRNWEEWEDGEPTYTWDEGIAP